MIRPNLPRYSDCENTLFHPVFKKAAEEAILAKGLEDLISVKSQYSSPTGPVDFVLFNNKTNKVLLPIEVKRTQSSVRGGGRRQGRDYWTNLGTECETPFYCVTNLELIELFRHDSGRPRTSAQKLTLVSPLSGLLESTPKDDFYGQLISTIAEMLDIALLVVSHKYGAGLTQFQTNLERKLDDPDGWHQLFIPVCFEYIRGAATQIASLKPQTHPWKSAAMYKSNPSRLVQLGSAIDFSYVFKAPETNLNDPVAFANSVIKEAFEAGKALGRGDDIAELVNEILQTPDAPGIVETDSELAQLLAVVARDALGGELLDDQDAFDPASGSGRLLTALPLIAFPSIGPSQIKANEKEILFAEALSLRLGLAFGSVLSLTNAPTITMSGIETIESNSLAKVKLVVMNPPYISGVQATGIKPLFANRIKEISDKSSLLDIGQAALEILFLELVWHLVPDGAVIATVFPAQHLTRISKETVKFRKFLIKEFGLSHIVIYPREGLFEDVIKQTVLLVGKKSVTPDENIKIVEVQGNVGDLDLSELMTQLKIGSLDPTHGVKVNNVLRTELESTASVGWKGIHGAGVEASRFVQSYMSNYVTVGSLGVKNVRRGMLGNNGNTALTVFSSTSPKYPSVVALIPPTWLCPVLNTTENMTRNLTTTNAPEMSFLPPQSAYVSNTADNLILNGIINEYVCVHETRGGSQAKAIKTPEIIQKDLKSNQKDFGAGWVLVQRSSRTKGEACLMEQAGVLLSTNVPMIRLPTIRDRKLFASWVLSVFAQIQFELVSTDQEGMRKLEVGTIRLVRFPDFSTIPAHIETALMASLSTEPAHNFQTIQHRPSDLLWAEVVCPGSPNDCLSEVLLAFQGMVDERRGFG